MSANGTLVVPEHSFRGKKIKNLKLTFTNGRMSGITADENLEDFKKSLDMSTGYKDVLSLVDIGINPNSKPMSGSGYHSWEMGGMVSLVMGNNSWAGGNVKADNQQSLQILI